MAGRGRLDDEKELLGIYISEHPLQQIAADIESMYRSNGIDNNYLESKILTVDEFALMTVEIETKDLVSRRTLKSALRYCVFQNKGAYGEHFSNHKAWQLAGLWTSRLRKIPAVTSLVEISGRSLIAWEIISAPCALTIIDADGDVLLLQGMGVD